MLMTEHNVNFYQTLMSELRAAIAEGRRRGLVPVSSGARYRGQQGADLIASAVIVVAPI